MKIGIIQASTQKSKNAILEDVLSQVINQERDEIINFGIREEDSTDMSYIHIALCISLLLESKAVDFIVTGCSSGQGMMLACNSLPGVICGYIQNVTDAYLFGRINDGNAVSYPLGFGWGWAAEINLKETLHAIFAEPLGVGYPKEDAERKRKDTETLKGINQLSKRGIEEILLLLDNDIVKCVLSYNPVYDYIMMYGKNKAAKDVIRKMRENPKTF